MSRFLSRSLVAFALFGAAAFSSAQLTVYTWTGLGINAGFPTPENWTGNVAPVESLTGTHLVFGNAGQTYVDYNFFSATPKAYKLEISGNSQPYYFQGPEGTMHLGAGGIEYNPTQSVRSTIRDTILLHDNQTWNIANGTLLIDGELYDYDWQTTIDGNFTVTKTGAGTLYLNSNDSGSWSGGLTLGAGQVVAPAVFDSFYFTPLVSNALGTGTLTFNGGTLVATPDYYDDDAQALILQNAIVSNGLIAVKGRVETRFNGPSVTLNDDTTIQTSGRPLFIETVVAESGGARKLIVDSATPVILEGSSGWTGGTEVINKGLLIFGGEDNTPGITSSFKVSADGYVGTGLDNNIGLFLSEFDKANTFGTIGFDSDPEGSTDTFIDPLDLTGFNASVRLGSATHAILGTTATITPQGAAYRFGGGGGWLQVDSLLTGTNSLVLESPASRPLTLYVTNLANNYTGGTSVTHSGVIFKEDAFDGAFSGAAGSITLNQGGYAGFESWGDQSELQMVNGSLARINPTSVGMVGFENTFISVDINLGAFTGGIYLGTATPVGYDGDYYGGINITGTITTGNGGADPYRFAGFKSGRLVVDSTLTGSAGVVIGDPNAPATFGDPSEEEYASVSLAGNNAGLTGNVTFYGGRLEVEQINGTLATDPTSALGTGSLIVQPMALPDEWKDADGALPLPELVARGDGMIIANNVTLNHSLLLGGFHGYTLNGIISGAGGLIVEREDDFTDFNFRLGGNNTFSGGTYVHGNNSSNTYLWLDHDNATGTGPLSFGSTGGVYVKFSTLAPQVGGLSTKDGDENVTLYATQTNTVLTINQSTDSVFQGQFRSAMVDPNDNFRIVKSGAGTLRLDGGGMYFYNGTTEAGLPGSPQVSLQIDQGTVVIGNDFYIEGSAPTLWVHGGTLVLDNHGGYDLYNPIVVDNGGKIAGNGFIAYSNLSIGTGATLSPGLDAGGATPIGRLDLWHLNANKGGTLEWDIMKADPSAKMWDQVFVSTPSTLTFADINLADANTAANRFTLKVISRTLTGTLGLLADFDPSQNYTWLVFDTNNLVSFDSGKVIIDTTLFANSLDAGAGNGYFYLTQNGTDLLLNFSPVPEPSTYALMLAGLAAAGLGYRRRKKRA